MPVMRAFFIHWKIENFYISLMGKQIALLVAILASYIFADTLHLKDGREIKDVVVVEIGISDVKYKFAGRDVLYVSRKMDIATIFYNDGSKEVFCDNNIVNYESTKPYENFTAAERFGTWALNALTVNGLGSWLIMDDELGGFVHLGLGLAAISSLIYAASQDCYDCNNNLSDQAFGLFYAFYVSGGIWNIYRSATYEKPRSVAHQDKYEGFNFAVLPNRNGKLMPILTYSKSF